MLKDILMQGLGQGEQQQAPQQPMQQFNPMQMMFPQGMGQPQMMGQARPDMFGQFNNPMAFLRRGL